jgi:hypothetical protein
MHAQLVAYLPVAVSTGKSSQHHRFFAGQSRVQLERVSALDANYFGFVFHGVT